MQPRSKNALDTFGWILVAKGLGITLVVIGHFYPDDSPEYWTEIRKFIYLFHMPLFFFLSGYLSSHQKYSYIDFIISKIKRLLYPFISMAIIFFLVKYSASRFFILEHPINAGSIYTLITDPVNSYAPLLWFVHALFLIFLVYPLLRIFLNNLAILVLFVALNMFFGNDHLIFGSALSHFPFFIAGAILRENKALNIAAIKKYKMSNIISSIAIACIYFFYQKSNYNSTKNTGFYFLNFTLGTIGSLFIISTSENLVEKYPKIANIFSQLGFYSMSIYLFHTLFESFVRIFFSQIIKGIHFPFEIIALAAIVCGLIFPLFLEMHIFRKYRFFRVPLGIGK